MKPLLAASAAAATLITTAGTIVGTALPARADVTDPNTLVVNNGVTYESCNDVPYSLKPLSDWGSAQSHAMGNAYGTYNYQVALNVIGPDGTVSDTRTVDRSADDLHQYGEDTGSFFVCDGAGNYVVQATGNWCWVNYTPTSNPAACQRVAFQRTFSMRAAKTKVTLKGAASYRISNNPLTLKTSVKIERSTGMFGLEDAAVKLQYRKGGRWVTYRSSYTSHAGAVRFSVKFADAGMFQFRAVVASDEDYKGSNSHVVKVRVTR